MTASPVLPDLPTPPPTGGTPRRTEAFDLKGTMASFTMLRLRSTDVELIERQLRVKIAQLPSLFLDAPVLVDLAPLGDQLAALSLGELVRAMRSCKLIPVAAANVPEELRAAVVEAGLGIWRAPLQGRGRDADSEETPEPGASERAPERGPELSAATEAAPATPAPVVVTQPPHTGPMVVTRPVRSGQVIHAHDNDLVVLAPVNPGAQVIADGHLHVYAPLRGRAVAGAQGLPGARIFCQKLEAELVAISGAYMMAEEIPPALRGKPVQVFLENGECRLAAL